MGEASAAAAVRVLAVVSGIAQAPGPAGSSTGDARVKLSFFDAPCVMLPPSQTVLLYDLLAGGDSADDEFPAAARRLKDSLAAMLALYPPLTGRLD